jgi:phospholipid-binding lipoprotein MlaA
MRLLILTLLLLLFCGCANKNATPNSELQIAQETQDIETDEFEDEFASSANSDFDPLEGYNRVMTSFNDAAIRYVMSPAAKGYKAVVPAGARASVGNFFDNLMFPIRFINNLLQGKVVNAFSEGGRFIINTTVGFLGFFNVASEVYEIKEHQEDFGQTLGVWGVPAGPHIVLPLLGPSNLRDLGGGFADSILSPTDYFAWRKVNMLDNGWQAVGADSFKAFNSFSQSADAYETMTKDAIDLYPFMKNMYEQRRNALIKE